MTSINDLLNKGKPQKDSTNAKNNPVKTDAQIQTGLRDGKDNSPDSGNQQSGTTGKKPLGIKLGISKNKPKSADEPVENQIHFAIQSGSPLAPLRDTLKNVPKNPLSPIKVVLGQNATQNGQASPSSNAENSETLQTTMDDRSPERRGNFDNPTLEDVSKFVFEEQPDDSTEEITEKFSIMMDNLSEALGPDVPSNLARCLKFMQEHAFLAEILKPEYIGDLVNGMRKSYGFIVKGQSEKQVKKAKNQEKEDAILGDLSNLNF